MSHATEDELWLGDDPMPSCRPCMNGDHVGCLDMAMVTPPYGQHACGCTNATCEEIHG